MQADKISTYKMAIIHNDKPWYLLAEVNIPDIKEENKIGETSRASTIGKDFYDNKEFSAINISQGLSIYSTNDEHLIAIKADNNINDIFSDEPESIAKKYGTDIIQKSDTKIEAYYDSENPEKIECTGADIIKFSEVEKMPNGEYTDGVLMVKGGWIDYMYRLYSERNVVYAFDYGTEKIYEVEIKESTINENNKSTEPT